MKITIEPTDEMAMANGTACRLWRGVSDEGTSVVVFVAAVAVPDDVDGTELDRFLREVPAVAVSVELNETMARVVDAAPPSSERRR